MDTRTSSVGGLEGLDVGSRVGEPDGEDVGCAYCKKKENGVYIYICQCDEEPRGREGKEE